MVIQLHQQSDSPEPLVLKVFLKSIELLGTKIIKNEVPKNKFILDLFY